MKTIKVFTGLMMVAMLSSGCAIGRQNHVVGHTDKVDGVDELGSSNGNYEKITDSKFYIAPIFDSTPNPQARKLPRVNHNNGHSGVNVNVYNGQAVQSPSGVTQNSTRQASFAYGSGWQHGRSRSRGRVSMHVFPDGSGGILHQHPASECSSLGCPPLY